MSDKPEERLSKFKERHPDFKAKDFFKYVLKDLDREVDLKWLNKIAVAFNCVAEKSIDNYIPFNMNRKFSYRTIKKVFKLREEFTVDQIKYLIKVMYSAINNEAESWLHTDIGVSLVEYSIVCCNDEVEALKQLSRLPHTTINESSYNQEHMKWKMLQTSSIA